MEPVDMIIQTPDGFIVDLKTIRGITSVKVMSDYVYFYLLYNCLNFDEGKCIFKYEFANYADDKDALVNKIENIRKEIGKRINNGNAVKEINAGINLKKAQN